MRSFSFTAVVFAIAASPIAFVSCSGASTPAADDSPRFNIDNLVQITPARIPVARQRMEFCIKPPDVGPHDVPEILVYANSAAVEYRRQHASEFNYPIGSKFVKEKFDAAVQAAPNAATVMIRKSQRGTISDWEFTSMSLPDKTPLGSTNQQSCIDCHEEFAERGFISRESEEALRRYLHLE